MNSWMIKVLGWNENYRSFEIALIDYQLCIMMNDDPTIKRRMTNFEYCSFHALLQWITVLLLSKECFAI